MMAAPFRLCLAVAFSLAVTVATADIGGLDVCEAREQNGGDGSPRGNRVKRGATALRERLWDSGVIPYEIARDFEGGYEHRLIKQAMRHWEENTCIKFVERTPSNAGHHPNYVTIVRLDGCFGPVGKLGIGPQELSLAWGCGDFRIVVHELGHTIGFWHEQSRPDRDEHVTIRYENVEPGKQHNFDKGNEKEIDSLGEPYDYESIMHYGHDAFAKNSSLDTIVSPEGHSQLVETQKLSPSDIRQANKLYKCPSCGATLSATSGFIESPDLPNYPVAGNNVSCAWQIVAAQGSTITLNLTDINLPHSTDCKHDYLEVRDGYWHKSPLLGRFCKKSHTSLPLIRSTGSWMLLTYKSWRFPGMRRGFAAKYKAECGGNLVLKGNETLQLESPGFPDAYDAGEPQECLWQITAESGQKMALVFHSLDLVNDDADENCTHNYLEVRDGYEPDSPILGIFCGKDRPPPLASSANELWIRLVSDGAGVAKLMEGFSVSVRAEVDECATGQHDCEQNCINTPGGYRCSCRSGFQLRQDQRRCQEACGGYFSLPENGRGTITSPHFPDKYPPKTTCTWTLVSPWYTQIRIRFTDFDLEGGRDGRSDCPFDYVQVQTQGIEESPWVDYGRFCGNSTPPSILSSKYAFHITFQSDISTQGTGFAFKYSVQNSMHVTTTVDIRKQDTPSGEFRSLNYPGPRPVEGDQRLLRLITAHGHRISVTFEDFDLGNQSLACNSTSGSGTESVDVRDGSIWTYSEYASRMGLYDDCRKPVVLEPYVTSGNYMAIVHKSPAASSNSSSSSGRGFRGKYTSICGGKLYSPEGVFVSHYNYGSHNYSSNENCEWIFEGWGRSTTVEITFDVFDIQCGGGGTGSSEDYVEIYDGKSKNSSASLGRFCGQDPPPTAIRSEQNSMVIVFVSDDDTVTGWGFSASFSVINANSAAH